MITESDLRAVFADEARDVSEPPDVMARLAFTQRSGHSRRAWLAPLAAAAAVVTIVSVAVAVGGDRNGVKAGAVGHTLPPMPGRDLRFAVSVGPVAGYTATNSYLVADRDTIDLGLAGNDQITAGEVVAYAAGAFDPTAVRRGQPVRVQGHQGYFARSPSSVDKVDHIGSHSVATLAWEFAADRWVVVQGWDAGGTPALQRLHLDAFTEEMRVARAVDTSAASSLLLPYRVGYLPAGLRHGGGRDTFPNAPDWQSYLWFLGPGQHGPDPSPPGLAISVDPAGTGRIAYGTFAIDGHPAVFEPASAGHPLTPSMRVSTAAPGSATPRDHVVPPTAKSAARSASGGVASLTVDFGPAVVTIHGNYSKAELVRIAHSMTLASDVNDQRTWFDATR
jgi:hypothetical protein